MKLVLLALSLSFAGGASEIKGVQVTGDNKALVSFAGTFSNEVPAWKVADGTLELTFQNATLAPELKGKLDVEAPHALIRRISVYSLDADTARAKVVMNGALEDLKSRVRLGKEAGNVLLSIDYPKGDNAALKLLEEEQAPITSLAAVKKADISSPIRTTVLFSLLVLVACGVVTFLVVKVLKKQGKLSGPRRYLIEQMAHCSLGNRMGVSLIRVGREFVLVGVTPNQVSLLSSLPKLESQYEEETQFERQSFNEAVSEEVRRIK